MRARHLATPVFLSSLLLLTACAGGDVGGEDTDDGGASGTVSVAAVWSGTEQENFQAVLDAFTEETGIETEYQSNADIGTFLGAQIEGGEPPDVALLPQPGLLRDFVEQDALIEVNEDAASAVEQDYAPVWSELATVDGKLYGVYFKAANKSTWWYNTQAFADAGVEPPADWDELLDQAGTVAQSGVPYLSVGGGDGWPLTDVFENIYLRTAGPEKYDQLFAGDLAFNDPSVKNALNEMLKMVNDQYVLGGIDGALGEDFIGAIGQVFGKNPKAEMYMLGGFVGGLATGQVNTDLKPGEDIDFFPFPEIDPAHGSPLVGAGDVAAAFVNNDDVSKLIEYLSTPEAGRIWVSTGAIVSPNRGVADDAYPNALVQKEADQVKNAKSFRFDGSDLLPGTLGQEFGTLLQNIIKNPNQMDSYLDRYQAQAKDAFASA